MAAVNALAWLALTRVELGDFDEALNNDDVPRHGHDVLAGEGGGGDEVARARGGYRSDSWPVGISVRTHPGIDSATASRYCARPPPVGHWFARMRPFFVAGYGGPGSRLKGRND